MRRLQVLLVVLAALVTSAASLPAVAAQEAGTIEVADVALVEALEATDLLTAWLDAGSVSTEAALLEVAGGSDYRQQRNALIGQLDVLTRRTAIDAARSARLDRAEARLDHLEDVVHDLRRQSVTNLGTADKALMARYLRHARVALERSARGRQVIGFSFDPLDVLEDRLGYVSDLVSHEAKLTGRRTDSGVKKADVSTARFSLLQSEIADVREIVAAGRQSALRAQLHRASDRAVVVEQMGALHTSRLLLPTAVGGLPLVTVDAYVRGSQAAPDGCSVDWDLLAGIGRVESRHGTIGDLHVQASGRVSQKILGPLLDGGASKAEAEAAAARAEEEAAARIAEEAAAVLAEEETQRQHFDSLVWGDDRPSLPVEPTEATEPAEERTEESVAPRFDPALWGDELPFADTDADEKAGSEGEENDDGGDSRPAGNGFAVIVDTDNGRLDGNSRWDRAVGPMQFIPETWSNWQTDGNGDGVMDPQNLYDAAASAARFLCNLQRTRGASPQVFVLGYNSSQTYVRNVLAVAETFASVSLPTAS